MRPLNQRGFSFLEILVAIAVLGGITLASMKIVQNQSGNDQYLKTRNEIQKRVANLKNALNDPENCRSALAGLVVSASGASVASIQIPLKGSPGFMQIIQSNFKYPDGVQTQNIRFIRPAGSPANLANLEIQFIEKSRNTEQWGISGTEKVTTETIPLIITTNALNQVTDCGPQVSESNNLAKQKFCLSLGAATFWDSLGNRCRFNDNLCPPGMIHTRMNNFGVKICDDIKNHIKLDDLFDEAPCSNTGNFSILDNGSGKLKLICN